MSIFCWIKTSAEGFQTIISTCTAAPGEAFNLIFGAAANGIIGVMGYAHDFYPTTGTKVNDGKWHQVGAVYNGSGIIKTYVDGRVDNSGSKNYATAGQDNYIGKSNHVGN